MLISKCKIHHINTMLCFEITTFRLSTCDLASVIQIMKRKRSQLRFRVAFTANGKRNRDSRLCFLEEISTQIRIVQNNSDF